MSKSQYFWINYWRSSRTVPFTEHACVCSNLNATTTGLWTGSKCFFHLYGSNFTNACIKGRQNSGFYETENFIFFFKLKPKKLATPACINSIAEGSSWPAIQCKFWVVTVGNWQAYVVGTCVYDLSLQLGIIILVHVGHNLLIGRSSILSVSRSSIRVYGHSSQA